MSWNKEQIDHVATASAPADYAAFERIGLSELPDARVLDVGCFDGCNTVLKFSPYANIAQVVGIDPTAAYIEQAREATDDARFVWEQASAEDYDGAAGSFDVVYFSHVFQHVADKKRTLENVFRLLKPGGFVVIKTFDDSVKISYPDPDNVMKRLFALYETEIISHVPHTSHTDRNNGQKCYTLLRHAGFSDIDVSIFTTDTANKTLEERMELFSRFTYFRAKTPPDVPAEVGREQRALLDAWKELFTHDDYYHASNTFMVVGRKPAGGDGDAVQAARASACVPAVLETRSGESCHIEQMAERDLGAVMRIEVNAFPDPWTPVAYAMELRHNPEARYRVLREADGRLVAYLGWWKTGQSAVLMHIATDPARRKKGLGRLLLEQACTEAAQEGCISMQLNVRAGNAPARAFYRALGFVETGLSTGYYTAPDDDAVFMEKTL